MKEKFKILVGVMAVMSAGIHGFEGIIHAAMLVSLMVVFAALLYRNRILFASAEILRLDMSDILFGSLCVCAAVVLIDGTPLMKAVYAGLAVMAVFFRKLWLKQPVMSEMLNH
ncbi:MAG: hypothetical protein ACYC69_02880 [Thermodesulfovibrionales bacterium]